MSKFFIPNVTELENRDNVETLAACWLLSYELPRLTIVPRKSSFEAYKIYDLLNHKTEVWSDRSNKGYWLGGVLFGFYPTIKDIKKFSRQFEIATHSLVLGWAASDDIEPLMQARGYTVINYQELLEDTNQRFPLNNK